MADPTATTSVLKTPKELATYLNVNTKTVYRRAWDGTWPCMRVGRGLRFVLADVLEAIRTTATAPSKDTSDVSSGGQQCPLK